MGTLRRVQRIKASSAIRHRNMAVLRNEAITHVTMTVGSLVERVVPRLLHPIQTARKMWKALARLLTPDFVLHRGYRLPPRELRGDMCGEAFRSNTFYLQSAVVEATRLPARLGYTRASRWLTWDAAWVVWRQGCWWSSGKSSTWASTQPQVPGLVPETHRALSSHVSVRSLRRCKRTVQPPG